MASGRLVAAGTGESAGLSAIHAFVAAHPDLFPAAAPMDAGLDATCYFEAPAPAYSNGAYAAVVAVDPTCGSVKVLRHVFVHDCGTVINPAIVEGQILGGVAQGIGRALLEELRFDGAGRLTTRELGEYIVPTASDLPPLVIDHVVTRSPRNPLGIKGMGEGGTIPVPAAIAAAVEDALRCSGTVTSVPITPGRLLELVGRAASPQVPLPTEVER
jgi:CO/xanthine dehydrogenase Mo-binding subunit